MKIHKHRFLIILIVFLLIIVLLGDASLALLRKVTLGTEGVSIFCIGGSIREGTTEKVCDDFPFGKLIAPKKVEIGQPITLTLNAFDDFGITKIGVNFGGGPGGEWHSCRCDSKQTQGGVRLPICDTIPYVTDSGQINCGAPKPGGKYSSESGYWLCKQCSNTWDPFFESDLGTYRYVSSIRDDNDDGHTAAWACYPDGFPDGSTYFEDFSIISGYRSSCKQDCIDLGQGFTDGYNREGSNFCNPYEGIVECLCYKNTEPYVQTVDVVDSKKPIVDIGISPTSPTPKDRVTFNAFAVDQYGISKVRIYIDENEDGDMADITGGMNEQHTCLLGQCGTTRGPYESGQTVKYYALAWDTSNNMGSTLPTKNFTVRCTNNDECPASAPICLTGCPADCTPSITCGTDNCAANERACVCPEGPIGLDPIVCIPSITCTDTSKFLSCVECFDNERPDGRSSQCFDESRNLYNTCDLVTNKCAFGPCTVNDNCGEGYCCTAQENPGPRIEPGQCIPTSPTDSRTRQPHLCVPG